MKKLLLPSVILIFSLSAHSQGLWQANGSGTVYTLRKTGIGTNNPTAALDVNGRAKFRGNTYFDSLLTAFTVQCDALNVLTDAVIKGSIHINKDAHVNGILTVGSPFVPCPKCGPASGGSIIFDAVKGSIVSSSGKIDFDGNDLVTTGSIFAKNATVSGTLNAQTILQNGNPINQTQWTSNPDSSISFPGTVFVKNLNSSEGVSIGNFRFSNGGAITPAPTDSIISPRPIAISAAKSIGIYADTVRFGKGIPGDVRLTVQGDIISSGTISSSSLSAASIQTSQLTINGGSVRADTLRANNSLTVNHSLLLAKENTNNYAEVSTMDANVALVLQKDSTGSGVGIGITPSAGEKLSVQGNVGVSGNLRLSNLADTSGNRMLVVDANGNLRTIGGAIPVPSCTDIFWRLDGNSIPVTCNPFIGTTTAREFIIKTNNIERLRILGSGTKAGNVGIGTTSPSEKLEVASGNILIKGTGNFQTNGHEAVLYLGDTNHYIKSIFGGGLRIGTYQSPDAIMLMQSNGSVGIGITTPQAKLHVVSNGIAPLILEQNQNANYNFGLLVKVQDTLTKAISMEKNGVTNFLVYGNGKVYAREVNVQMAPFPDYVFKKEYNLMSIENLEKFIDTTGHLPGLPSAEQVAENGIGIGELQIKLLEKVEELSLYVIELKKENEEIKNRLKNNK